MILGKKEHLVEYRQDKAINASLLKKYLYPPFEDADKEELYYEEYKAMEIGSMVDALETMEEGIFEDLYYIGADIEKPSKTMLSICHYIYDRAEGSLEENTDLILEAVKVGEHYKNWKDETTIKNVIEKCGDYYKSLIESEGKFVVSNEMMSKVHQHVLNLHSSEYTDLLMTEHSELIILNQVPIYSDIKGFKTKCLIDKIYINPTDKDITVCGITFKRNSVKVCDLKTTDTQLKGFELICKKFNYALQLSYYTEHLLKYVQGNAHSPVLDGYISGDVEDLSTYEVGEPFIIVSSSHGGAMTVSFDSNTMEAAKYGSRSYISEGYSRHFGSIIDIPVERLRPMNGWIQAFNNYLEHKENPFYTRHVIDNNGHLVISIK